MLKLNEMVMYGTTGVCVIESIEDKKIGKETRRYYVLKPVTQSASTVFIPADNDKLLSKARRVLSEKEVRGIISTMNSEPDIWPENDAERREIFKDIISSGDRKSCLVLLRSLQNRQTFLAGQGKRLHIADERAMKEAQRLVHDEFSVALNIRPEEVSTFIHHELNMVD